MVNLSYPINSIFYIQSGQVLKFSENIFECSVSVGTVSGVLNYLFILIIFSVHQYRAKKKSEVYAKKMMPR